MQYIIDRLAAVIAVVVCVLAATPAWACGGNQCPTHGGGGKADAWQVATAQGWGQLRTAFARTAGGLHQSNGRLTHWSLAESGAFAASRVSERSSGEVRAVALSAQSIGFKAGGFCGGTC